MDVHRHEMLEPECLWFHAWLSALWEGSLLLWKKLAVLSKSLTGGKN